MNVIRFKEGVGPVKVLNDLTLQDRISSVFNGLDKELVAELGNNPLQKFVERYVNPNILNGTVSVVDGNRFVYKPNMGSLIFVKTKPDCSDIKLYDETSLGKRVTREYNQNGKGMSKAQFVYQFYMNRGMIENGILGVIKDSNSERLIFQYSGEAVNSCVHLAYSFLNHALMDVAVRDSWFMHNFIPEYFHPMQGICGTVFSINDFEISDNPKSLVMVLVNMMLQSNIMSREQSSRLMQDLDSILTRYKRIGAVRG